MGQKRGGKGNLTRREARGSKGEGCDPWMSSFIWGWMNTSWGVYHRRRRGERRTREPKFNQEGRGWIKGNSM